ncbi:MAG: hypothetical protein NC489_08065 [Ruminococcus flavefaciens]|nr:hypothetical protein [Ruminococcus flavefaciens]
MRVIKNEPVIQKLSSTLSQRELSNVAMILDSPTIITNWWLIDPDRTTTVPGFKNVDAYIGQDSQVVYNFIEGVPIGGISDLTTQSRYNEEVGYNEEFTSQGIAYPNTLVPIPGSCFAIQSAQMRALYIVTDIVPSTVRSNPFLEFTFELFTRDLNKIKQIDRQVHNRHTCCLSTIGTSKSLILENSTIDGINTHVKNYLELCDLYKDLFYSDRAAAFVFDGFPDREGNRARFIDMTLWRLLFDEGIVIYDDTVTYANSNSIAKTARTYTACPDVYVSDHDYRRSILYQILSKERPKRFDEYRYPYIWKPTERLTKFEGINIWYLEGYGKYPAEERFADFYLWDDDFLCKIRNNEPYEVDGDRGYQCHPDACSHCTQPCTGKPVQCINPYLRNIIINWINGNAEIDLGELMLNLEVIDSPTIENYYLIPLVLGIYKQYIKGLIDAGTTL